MNDEKLILRCERHEKLGAPECDIVDAMSWQISQLEAQLAEKDAFIAGMVTKAAALHRPAYDEQQRRISQLEAQLATMRENFERADDLRALYVRSYNSLAMEKKYE